MASDPISPAISNGAMAPPDMIPCFPARISSFFGIHKVANVTAALLIEKKQSLRVYDLYLSEHGTTPPSRCVGMALS
ncbi:hypothetical protein A1F94_007909 [Pyrenophora tritici-repentis]|nr:hypothetical protein A1F94_007909 [Pyrenophora tritici-repentis]